MGYTATKLVEIATAEIGYHEKASNSNLDSKTNNGKIKANKRNFSHRLFADNGNFSNVVQKQGQKLH